MIKKTKQDLMETALNLKKSGYKNLHATNDGYFFTDRELAASHAKSIDSEVFLFSDEDFANVPVDEETAVPEAETIKTYIPEVENKPKPVKSKNTPKPKNN